MDYITWKRIAGKGSLEDISPLHKRCLDTMSKIDKLKGNKWHFFRKLLNQYDFESREVAVNRAFYKLWEIMRSLQSNVTKITAENKDELKVLHLAEAPGSFVQVVKKLYPNSQAWAVSKPPSSYAEVVRKSKTVPVFAPAVLALPNCTFLYSDLINSAAELCNFIRTDQKDGFQLITADGGFDEEEQYDAKEVLHYNLILSEVICVLLNQRKDGCCVLKIFETFTDTTLHILWLLCQHYDEYTIVKPSTSRPTNAERYVICKGFKGCKFTRENLLQLTQYNLTTLDTKISLFRHLPISFIETVKKSAQELTETQIQSIDSVLAFVSQRSTKDGFIYVDKSPFIHMKQRSFEEWKERFQYDDQK